ncbi:hypothetical protein K227x_49840 [Rubripirellula lacrimiformis]|uniref:Uncharacterized protein n=2 Tax=Rubripirellula lacrimiformis TaxID=1930273 RepID=A0A517NHF8_9BACT|nr:hypothetical protein K227x_49840 [Rubripirellula lacrimiformis]
MASVQASTTRSFWISRQDSPAATGNDTAAGNDNSCRYCHTAHASSSRMTAPFHKIIPQNADDRTIHVCAWPGITVKDPPFRNLFFGNHQAADAVLTPDWIA